MQIKNKIIPIIIFFLSLLTTNLVLYADEFDISASEISIDKENEIITGKGSVEVNDEQGRIINPPPRPDNATRKDLYNIRVVDVRLTFRSKKEFFRFKANEDKPRLVKGLGDRTREFFDKFLRDSVVVTVHTRNIGAGS